MTRGAAPSAHTIVARARRESDFYARKLARLGRVAQSEPLLERIPVTTLDELADEKLRTDDAFSSRRSRNRDALVSLQLEYHLETPLYMGLDRADLQAYAGALARTWQLLGIRAGSRVAIFDYGTSPVAYLASSFFMPYLRKGAAEVLGCVPVCNDGVASMSPRAVEILKYVRPSVVFARGDVLAPFAAEVERQGLRLGAQVELLVATDNERVLGEDARRGFEQRLGVPIARLARADASLFLAVECRPCRLFHTWPDLYRVEVLDETLQTPLPRGQQGSLAITTLFARVCHSLRVVSELRGALALAGCPHAPGAERVTL